MQLPDELNSKKQDPEDEYNTTANRFFCLYALPIINKRTKKE